MKERLDNLLVRSGLAETRSRAKLLISEGSVVVNGEVVTKAGSLFDEPKIEIKKVKSYVSRAGEKLEGASEEFGLGFTDKVVLDVGASTGGFCDYMLSKNAKKIFALDVGSSQLAPKILNDKRVVNLEKTDIRNFVTKEKLDFITIDVSFISQTLIAKKIFELSSDDTLVVSLVKPQFECGKAEARRHGGVIKDEKVRKDALKKVISAYESVGFKLLNTAVSKIKGGDGNIEYFCLFKK